jgi:hypothetical protein
MVGTGGAGPSGEFNVSLIVFVIVTISFPYGIAFSRDKLLLRVYRFCVVVEHGLN